MGIDPASATLLSGGMQTGASLIAGILNYYATKDTNRKNLELAMLTRSDTLAAQKAAEKLAKQELALKKRQVEFGEKQTELSRHEAKEEKAYGRLQNAYQRGMDIFNKQLELNAIKAAPFQKYAGGK